ncbi:MAG TPA: 2-dehydropantoate 2-reductase [Marmoricola sp.]|jgi:2-dehydropantoate 2-reductase|nr:2-dehydropantoate 2-reductase [Marmoricola sp.]
MGTVVPIAGPQHHYRERVICIVGAGSIGCYVGGRLAAAGADVVFVGRQRLADEVAEHGLRLTDYRGADLYVDTPRFTTDVAAAADADLVLVTVKSDATAEVASDLAAVLPPDALVVSLQNGIHNTATLDAALGGGRTLAGMVPFNVAHLGDGVFHQGSEGDLEAARDSRLEAFAPAFAAAGLPLVLHDDMPAVLWAKLLLNLNNAVNALSGLPLKTELGQRDYRACLAMAQREALGILTAAGVRPARITPLPPSLVPRLLGVPDAVFRVLASSMLEIDPIARSSMADDLALGRRTEIDWINGEVVRLAESIGTPAPVNARLIALVRAAEDGGRHDWGGAELKAQLRAAR